MDAVPPAYRDKEHSPDETIARVAARQATVVSTRQLVGAGLSRSAIGRRVAGGRLFRQHRGVYSLLPSLSRRGQFFAAVLACGDGAILSHLSAGHEHGVRRHDYGPVHVTVPRAGVRSQPGIVVHATRGPIPAVTLHGLPVTTVARTLTDLADVLNATALQQTVSTAERRGLVDRTTFVPAPGRRRPFARPHLFTRSQNERQMLSICATYGLGRPLVNQDVDGWEVDFLWPGLALEVDAWHTHGNPVVFERDRAKDEFLELHRGLMVRRVTDTRLHHEPHGVAAVVRRALQVVAARGRRVTP